MATLKEVMSRLVKEKWKSVKGFKGVYDISNLGRLRSCKRVIKSKGDGVRTVEEVILKGYLCKGYIHVRLSNGKVKVRASIHRLVAQAFKRNPKNKPYVNHLNGIKDDNRASNLVWSTPSENVQHAYDTGLITPLLGELHRGSALTSSQVLTVCSLLDSGSLTHKEIADIFEVSRATIGSINNGEVWNHLTKRLGRIHSVNMSGSSNPRARAVINCRGETFGTVNEASEAYRLKSRTHISRVCKGYQHSAGKYLDGTPIKWYYKSDYTTEFIIMDNAIDGHPGE